MKGILVFFVIVLVLSGCDYKAKAIARNETAAPARDMECMVDGIRQVVPAGTRHVTWRFRWPFSVYNMMAHEFSVKVREIGGSWSIEKDAQLYDGEQLYIDISDSGFTLSTTY